MKTIKKKKKKKKYALHTCSSSSIPSIEHSETINWFKSTKMFTKHHIECLEHKTTDFATSTRLDLQRNNNIRQNYEQYIRNIIQDCLIWLRRLLYNIIHCTSMGNKQYVDLFKIFTRVYQINEFLPPYNIADTIKTAAI